MGFHLHEVNFMIKTIAFLIISSFLLLLPQQAIAADALYRMLHADEVEDFKADQDVIIVGQLISQSGDYFTVEVNKVISGSVDSDKILLYSDFQYGWGDTSEGAMIPKVNDYCVMSLKKYGSYYKKAWGIFNATNSDYKTLKLHSEDIKYPYYTGDIAAIEWYVNSGGTEKDFFFNENRVYVKRPNGEILLVHDEAESNASTIKTESSHDGKTVNSFINVKSVILLIAVSCALAITIIIKRKRL
jgi:hypothetical protein